MWRFICTLVGCLCVSLAFLVPPLQAQGQTQDQTQAEGGSQKSSALPYAVALLATIIVMVIVCTPSRKREVEKR
jgi:ABC-type uncharacterized transport system permease subunit